MKRIGVFVDTSNLYFCIGKKWPNRKLDYKKFIEYIKDLGEVQQAIAYGSQLDTEAEGFIFCLKQLGFTPKYKAPRTFADNPTKIKSRADWDVGITVDAIEMMDRLDIIILGTGDDDLIPLAEYAKRKGVDVIAFACGISRKLKDTVSKYIEIPESLLEDGVRTNKTEEVYISVDTEDDETNG